MENNIKAKVKRHAIAIQTVEPFNICLVSKFLSPLVMTTVACAVLVLVTNSQAQTPTSSSKAAHGRNIYRNGCPGRKWVLYHQPPNPGRRQSTGGHGPNCKSQASFWFQLRCCLLHGKGRHVGNNKLRKLFAHNENNGHQGHVCRSNVCSEFAGERYKRNPGRCLC